LPPGLPGAALVSKRQVGLVIHMMHPVAMPIGLDGASGTL
jgi:hypothetical protein